MAKEDQMEFLVDFKVNIPDGTPESEVRDRDSAEAIAASKLVEQGHLRRLWKESGADGETRSLGLYRADSELELEALLGALPLAEWMHVTVTPLAPHPNDPPEGRPGKKHAMSAPLPSPRVTRVYRLEATVGQTLDLGDISEGHRRIVPLDGGTFTGPELSGRLLPGASADWQIVSPDGTVLGDIRYTLQTDRGDLLYVQSRSVRHGSSEILARLGRGDDVDASEYTFRTSTRIETAAPDLDWLNKGIFISVAGRQAGGVIYETYLVA
jgi:muconolactone delta-isomerase